MKCAQFTEFARPLEIVDREDPVPAAHGAVIEIRAAGLCRSDWHAWQGHDADIKALPHVPGHEFAGVVSAVGTEVTQWKVGDRVTAPFACGCSHCPECRSGNAQVCPDQYQPGFTGPGAFAERLALPNADHNLVALPETVDFAEAASLGCRFATAYRALAHADQAALQPGESIAVFGCGGVGLSAVMIAVSLGATVIAVDKKPSALEAASALGAQHAVSSNAVETIRDLTEGRGVEVAVDALGKTETCLQGISSLAPRGRHVQIGLMFGIDAHPALPMGPIIAKELHLIGSHGMAASRYPEMLARIANGTLAPQRLISNSISLPDLPKAMEEFGQHRGTAGITLIDHFS
jgi:alcohol dehydrogenase